MAIEPPEFLIRMILVPLQNDQLFEEFCVRHYTHVEGIRYVRTSYNYDQGRDGRTEFGSRSGESYICASTTKTEDPVKKAFSDLGRLLEADSSPAKVRFCFTAEVTEPKRDLINKAVWTGTKHTKVEVVGLPQLIGSIKGTPGAFNDIFSTEIDAYNRYAGLRQAAKNEVIGLRSAMGTLLTSNATLLRQEVLKGITLDCLEKRSPRTHQELLGAVAQQTGLLSPPHDAYLGVVLAEMIRDGWVERSADEFRLRLAGREEVDRRRKVAAERAVSGCAAIRSLLQNAVGYSISNKAYTKIWHVIEDGLAGLFLQHGMAITREISELATGNVPYRSASGSAITEGVARIASRIRAIDLGGKLVNDVADMLPHVLSSRDGPGFEFLSHLCILYIATCSLALDPEAQDRVLDRVRNWEVILDTHVILSAIGDGEPEHEAVNQVMLGWKSVGGSFYVAPSVIEEVSNHARLGLRSLDKWQLAFRRQQRRANRRGECVIPPDNNVLLRGYIHKAEGVCTPGGCQMYLYRFVQPGDKDASRTRDVLTNEFGLSVLSEDGIDEELAKKVAKSILKYRTGNDQEETEHGHDCRYRCNLDGRLVALLARRRELTRLTSRFPVIVSLSSGLRHACEPLIAKLGYESAIISLSRLSFALALAPRASMNLQTLRTVLFEAEFANHVSPTYDVARRVFKAQGERSELVFAGTRQLQEMVDQSLAGDGPKYVEQPSRIIRHRHKRGGLDR